MVSAHVPPIYTWKCLDFKIFIKKNANFIKENLRQIVKKIKKNKNWRKLKYRFKGNKLFLYYNSN